jgi:hypothetical protein
MKRVYFARVAGTTGPIKIGCSSGPPARCKQLGFDLAADIEVIAFVPGDYFLERNLHLKFASLRAPGPRRAGRAAPVHGHKEWFHPAPALLELIEAARRDGVIVLRADECRERIIADRYRGGETLQEIAVDFNITRERVRQVLRALGVPSRGTLPEHRRRSGRPQGCRNRLKIAA